MVGGDEDAPGKLRGWAGRDNGVAGGGAWPPARGVGRAEDGDGGGAERVGDVRRTRVGSDEKVEGGDDGAEGGEVRAPAEVEGGQGGGAESAGLAAEEGERAVVRHQGIEGRKEAGGQLLAVLAGVQVEADERARAPGQQLRRRQAVAGQEGEFERVTVAGGAQGAGQGEEALAFAAAAGEGHGEVEAVWRVAGADEAGGCAGAEHEREGIRIDARAVELEREVEALGLHLVKERVCASGFEELLGDAGPAGERHVPVEVRRASDERRDGWQADQCHLGAWEMAADGPERGRRADEITNARGADDGEPPDPGRVGEERGEGVPTHRSGVFAVGAIQPEEVALVPVAQVFLVEEDELALVGGIEPLVPVDAQEAFAVLAVGREAKHPGALVALGARDGRPAARGALRPGGE